MLLSPLSVAIVAVLDSQGHCRDQHTTLPSSWQAWQATRAPAAATVTACATWTAASSELINACINDKFCSIESFATMVECTCLHSCSACFVFSKGFELFAACVPYHMVSSCRNLDVEIHVNTVWHTQEHSKIVCQW